MLDNDLLQDVSLKVCHAHCVLTCSHMNQQWSTDVRQNVQIPCASVNVLFASLCSCSCIPPQGIRV